MTKPVFYHIIGLLMLSFGLNIILASTTHFQESSIIYAQSSSAATTLAPITNLGE
jgi:hypothetical protein